MMKAKVLLSGIFFLLCAATVSNALAQEQEAKTETKKKKTRTGSLYLSWGYNKEWYTRSTIHINQPGLNSDYEMVKVKAHDHPGWNEGSLLKIPLTIPQYSYRIGYYFNDKQDLAIELNFDHTKYLIQNNQIIRIKGKRNGVAVDEDINFSENNGFYYFLNNGANFFLINLVKRFGLYKSNDRNLAVDLLCKAGVGPVVPHVENRLFGVPNDAGFQLGGWNTGLETALKVTVMKYGFVEFSQKVDYARYSNLAVASGRARHAFGTYELILSAGVIFPTTRNHPGYTSAAPKAVGDK